MLGYHLVPDGPKDASMALGIAMLPMGMRTDDACVDSVLFAEFEEIFLEFSTLIHYDRFRDAVGNDPCLEQLTRDMI